jgi:putative Mg2+ transporter-C (MgtC) family protein
MLMDEPGLRNDVLQILLRLLLAGAIGGVIGYERRMYHKAVGISGMILVAVGSATYMMLAQHVSASDPAATSRTLQGLLQGIGFLGGAVIFKGGADVRGIKTAAAIWITGAIGLAAGTGFWWLGLTVGVAVALILFLADLTEPARLKGPENEAAAQEKGETA